MVIVFISKYDHNKLCSMVEILILKAVFISKYDHNKLCSMVDILILKA